MYELRRSIFGYYQDDVDQFFNNRESVSRSLIKEKYAEVEKIREDNHQKKAMINAAVEETENLNQTKDQIFNVFIEQLTAIENSIKSTDLELTNNKTAVLDKLQQKINEYNDWNNRLKQCYTDIAKIGDKYSYIK